MQTRATTYLNDVRNYLNSSGKPPQEKNSHNETAKDKALLMQ